MYKILATIISLIAISACSNKIKMGKKNDKTTTIEEVVVVPNKSPKADVLNNNKDAFPQSWFGNWEGTLEIYNAKGLAQTIPMELVMAATDTVGVYKWYIIYGTDREKGLRPYLLRTIDASKGHYQCDELNSIKMDSYLLGNKLFCNFIVEGNLLISVYEKDGENMKFEIIFGKEKPVSETGGEIVKGDTIPKVRTLPVLINQKAVLKKKT